MKKNLFLPVFLLMPILWQSSIYNIEAISINGTNISIGSFANNRIIITAFNAAYPDINWLLQLDSLQQSDTSLRVIAVPANDFGSAGNDIELASLKDSLSLGILMLKSAFVKKSSGANQHPLFKWLTDVNENTHFDLDVESPRQLFIVSRTGILYSVLSADVLSNVLTQVLNQNVE